MTQPVQLAQTGASSQAASLFGGAAVLDIKWRLGGSKIGPSAEIGVPKADSAGKKADFAQTLRDRKGKAAEAEPTPKAKVERDRPDHAEGSRPQPRKSKRTEEKAHAEDQRADASDDAAPKDEAGESPDAAQTEGADKNRAETEDKNAQPDQKPVERAVDVAVRPVEVAPPPAEIPAVPVQANPAANDAPEALPLPDDHAGTTLPASKPADAKSSAQVRAPVGPEAATAEAANNEPESVRAGAREPVAGAGGNAAKGEAKRAERPAEVEVDGKAVRTHEANSAADPKPKPIEASHAGKAGAHAREQVPAESRSEPVTPASESGSRPSTATTAGEGSASDRKDDPEFVPAPVKQPVTTPAQGGVPQAPRVEATANATKLAEAVAGAPAAQAAEGVPDAPRVEGVQGVQASPSAEMLRALAPAHSPASLNPVPQQAQAHAAANQDYQRLLGQQVERGIAQAIQQATAATDSMVMGTGAVVLRLHPANLGQLRVQIRFESGTGGVRARFEASSSRAKGLLGGSIESLKSALEGRGLRVDEVVVAQSPRLPEPDLGAFVPEVAPDGRAGGGDPGSGFASGREQAAPLPFGAPAGGASRGSSAETGNDIPIGGLGERPVWLTGAAGWTVDADGNIRVDALV
ncbi:MAG TPA: flagellar hook-length control protein FliK [Phycisphaerales bacterium]|nr:flagellar hook-length control protein FliK [Phycisphaerales bacterium]